MTLQPSPTIEVLAGPERQIPWTVAAGVFGQTLRSVDDFRAILDRHDSGKYGNKEHKKANESFQEVLQYCICLLRVLKRQQEEEAIIDEATITFAESKRGQVQTLLRRLEQPATGSRWRKAFGWSTRKNELYGIDLNHLRLLENGLQTLIENLQSARKRKLSVRQNIDKTITRTQGFGELHNDDTSVVVDPKELSLAKDIFNRLKTPFLPYWKRHEQCSKERVQNTCKWILEHEVFRQWMGLSDNWYTRRRLLWLHGGAGTGKSILASYVINTTRSHSKLVIYSYFGNSLVQTVPELVASLLAQLWAAAGTDASAITHQSEYNAVEKFDQWAHACFQDFTKEFKPSPIIVLDGWDADRMDEPLRFEKILSALLRIGCSVFVTSRSRPHFATANVEFQEFYTLSVPAEAQRADLITFCEQIIANSPNAPAYDLVKESKDNIITTVVGGYGDKSFHRTRLYLELALQQTSEAEMIAVLRESNPVNLIFQENTGYPARQISQASLLWLSQTRQPMKTDALREALALLLSTTIQHLHPSVIWNTFPAANQLPTLAFVRSCGTSFLRVDEASDTVALNQNIALPDLVPSQNHAIRMLADMCISVLSIHELDAFDYSDLDVVREYASNHQFLCHAASTFQLHIENDEVSEYMRPTLWQVLQNRKRLYRVIALRDWCRQRSYETATLTWKNSVEKVEQTTAIQVVIECGDQKMLQEFLNSSRLRLSNETRDSPQSLNRAEVESWCLLAFELEHRRKCFDPLYGLLLDLALSDRRFPSLVNEDSSRSLKLVPSRHSDSHDGRWASVYEWFDRRYGIAGYETNLEKLKSKELLALRSAWSRASTLTVRGALVAYVLESTAFDNDTELLEKLLRCGFSPSPRLMAADRQEHSPLHAAAQVGSMKMVKLLLDNGADVNVVNAEGKTALFSAIQFAQKQNASADSIALISALLASGIETDTPTGNERTTALDFAIAKGLVPVVELLLRYGARSLQNQTRSSSLVLNENSSSSTLTKTTTNDSFASSDEEIRSLLERRQRTLQRLQESRARRVANSYMK